MDVVVVIEGEENTGKTTLALTFPRPIYHVDLDVGGFRRASYRFGKEVSAGQIVSVSHIPEQPTLNGPSVRQGNRVVVGMKEVWYEVQSNVMTMASSSAIQTIVIDSLSQLWDVCYLGFLQERQERKPEKQTLDPMEYREPNARMLGIMNACRRYEKNLVLTAHLKDEYAERLDANGVKISYKTGQKEHSGWGHVMKYADIAVRMSTKVVKDDGKKSKVFVPEITMCKLTSAAEGFSLDNATWDVLYSYIMALRGE